MLRYGLNVETEQTRIQAEFDDSFLERALNQHPDFIENSNQAVEELTLYTELVDDDHHLYQFDFAKAWRKRSPARRLLASEAAKNALVVVCNTFTGGEDDPLLRVGIGLERFAEGRLDMHASLTWPDVPDDALSELATEHMQRVARDLHYPPGRNKPKMSEMIYASVNWQRGITLQTNPIGACEICTDGMRYEPENPTVELGAQNIYSRDQQIICLAGAIAIAHAAELV